MAFEPVTRECALDADAERQQQLTAWIGVEPRRRIMPKFDVCDALQPRAGAMSPRSSGAGQGAEELSDGGADFMR